MPNRSFYSRNLSNTNRRNRPSDLGNQFSAIQLNKFCKKSSADAIYSRVAVGKVVDSNEIGQMNLVLYRNSFAGANNGGIRETQDVIDSCALNKIKPGSTKISTPPAKTNLNF